MIEYFEVYWGGGEICFVFYVYLSLYLLRSCRNLRGRDGFFYQRERRLERKENENVYRYMYMIRYTVGVMVQIGQKRREKFRESQGLQECVYDKIKEVEEFKERFGEVDIELERGYKYMERVEIERRSKKGRGGEREQRRREWRKWLKDKEKWKIYEI